jgi:hypothetical protein
VNSPTIDVLLAAGLEPTLDAWLEMNDASGVYDAELLEVIPQEFGLRDEYEDRLRLHSEYEAKWEARQSAAELRAVTLPGSLNAAEGE